MKPKWMRRHLSCPDCGLIVEIEDAPKYENWGAPFVMGLPAVAFNCSRCKAHYTAEEFYADHDDKYSKEASLESETDDEN